MTKFPTLNNIQCVAIYFYLELCFTVKILSLEFKNVFDFIRANIIDI